MSALAFQEDEPRPKIEELAISEITDDPEISARQTDLTRVADYAERMGEGDVFPPIDVMQEGAIMALTYLG